MKQLAISHLAEELRPTGVKLQLTEVWDEGKQPAIPANPVAPAYTEVVADSSTKCTAIQVPTDDEVDARTKLIVHQTLSDSSRRKKT